MGRNALGSIAAFSNGIKAKIKRKIHITIVNRKLHPEKRDCCFYF